MTGVQTCALPISSAKRSSHTYNNGFDLYIGSAKSEEEIRKRLGARGINVTKVIRETGQGRNQGTGPHWHIEIDGPTGNRQAGAGSAAGKMNVQSRDRKSTRLNSSHYCASRMPSSA